MKVPQVFSSIMGKAQASLSRISHTIHLLLVFAFIVHGQNEFMNIDCGKPRDYHGSDMVTGLRYESDYEYIDTGVTQSISSVFQGSSVPSQAYDLRSFPNGTRNCYSLTPVLPGKKYLIRASFLYGNYDGKSFFPKFDLYLGTIPWETISISSSSVMFDTTIYSVASSNYLFVCLINIGSGTPFISSLELRPLDDEIYGRHINATNTVSMVSVDLVNFGVSIDPVVRYPQDPYDRVWRSYGEPGWTKLYTASDVGTKNSYKPPSLVMQTAVAPTSGSRLHFSIMLGDSTVYSMYLIFMHFAEIQVLNQNASRKFTISRNDIDIFDEMVPDYLSINTIYTIRSQHFEKLEHSLYMTNGSTLPPMINAIEVYKVRDSEQVSTRSEDVEAIRDIKSFYHLKNWTGDPCAPREFTWDGLVCSYDGSPKIKTLNLRASRLNGVLRISICNLTELQELDLSTNELSGPIPSCLANLRQLRLLNITNSGLKGPVPGALLSRSRDGLLKISFEDSRKLPPTPSKSQQPPSPTKDHRSNAGTPSVGSNVQLVIAIATFFSVALLF